MSYTKKDKKTGKTPKGPAGNTESVEKKIDDLIAALGTANPVTGALPKLLKGATRTGRAAIGKQYKPGTTETVKTGEIRKDIPANPHGITVGYSLKRGGMVSKKKSAKKSKKSGRAAKRGYGIAKKGK